VPLLRAMSTFTGPTDRPTPLATEAAELRIIRARALRGANLWSRSPVVVADMRLGALAARSRSDASEALARLEAELPGLAGTEVATNIDATRIHAASAWWGELVVRVASALQQCAGAPASVGRIVLSVPADDRWTIAIEYEEEALTIEAVYEAARIVRDALRGDDPEIAATAATLASVYERARPDSSARLVIAAARRRGIPVRRTPDDDTIQLGLGRTQRRVRGSFTERTSAMAATIAGDAPRVRRLLDGVGVPVPRGDRARSLDHALEIAADLRFPVRLLREGESVPGARLLANDAALRAAWPLPAREGEHVVERAADGSLHQVLVVGGRVVAARVQPESAAASSRGAEVDIARDMHPNVRALCELAAGAIGLDAAQVDLVTSDIGAPMSVTRGLVTAVHASPDLSSFAEDGAAIGDAIVDMLYPPGASTTIPVIAITGTNGKTTTTRLIAHLMRQTGRTVGFTTTDGVYLQEQLLMYGDLTGPFAANVILSHRDTEVAVLETARGGILKSGLGFEACDVAVVMNVTADHLGLRGIDTVEQLAEVKAVLPLAVRADGCAVLNADDSLVLGMRARTAGRIALFTTRPAEADSAAAQHRARGGILACVELVGDVEHLMISDGDERHDLGIASEIPLTFGGFARFQLQNVLAAATAAYLQGATIAQIREGLGTFIPSSATTPGRLNLVETPRGRVLLDYAHNAAAISGLFEFVRAMPATRRMALLSAPGDRRDEDLRAIGRLAEGLDYVIMKEHDVYRRGRAPGAIAELMADGLRATGFPESRLRTFAEEHEAVAHVMAKMERGDVVIIIADDTRAVEAQLREMR
jgi:cyanophycin synthetase